MLTLCECVRARVCGCNVCMYFYRVEVFSFLNTIPSFQFKTKTQARLNCGIVILFENLKDGIV
jgi:hypothetical protein